MRKMFLLPLALCLQITMLAQDKIVTISGDTILCRIVSISNDHIVYEQQIDKKNILGKTILLSEVGEYFREPYTQLTNGLFSSRAPEKVWLLGLSVGGGHLPWLLENVTEESAGNSDYKKMDDGFALNANVHYLVTQNVGFGIQYSFFTSGYKGNYPTMIELSYPIYSNSTIRERQYIHYAGISVLFRQFLDGNHKFSLNETFGGGLLLYRAESQSSTFLPYTTGFYTTSFSNFSQNALVTGQTFGASLGISAEYKILPYLSVGFGGNLLYGKLSKAGGEYKTSFGDFGKFSDQDLDNPLKLSRIDYSLLIRFHL